MRKALAAACFCLLFAAGCATETTASLKSTFDQGVEAYDAGDYAKAYKLWTSIDNDDIAAMRNVAMLLRTGKGVKKDPATAEDMFERAAEAGLPNAQADLADMLLKGEAGPPDPRRALPLLVAAAAANHPVAEFELGQMYETGELVPKNLTTARHLYAAAAQHGMKEAQDRLDALPPEPASTTPPNGTPPANGNLSAATGPLAIQPAKP